MCGRLTAGWISYFKPAGIFADEKVGAEWADAHGMRVLHLAWDSRLDFESQELAYLANFVP